MPGFARTWIANCLGLFAASAVIPPFGFGHRIGTLLLAGLILGIVNFALRPLVVLVSLPAVILSLGVALLLVNALMLWVTSRLVTGLHLGGFVATVGAAIVIWLVNLALGPWRRRDGRRGGGRRGRGRAGRRGRGRGGRRAVAR